MTTGSGEAGGPASEPALEELTREECLRLLGSQAVGRVAVADFGSAPLVLPVNFVLLDDVVLFRSDYGTKFRLMVLAEHPVSFQVDQIDPGRRTGWSVLVQGEAHEGIPEHAGPSGLEPWAPGVKRHWIHIIPDVVTGRRIRLPEMPGFDARGCL